MEMEIRPLLVRKAGRDLEGRPIGLYKCPECLGEFKEFTFRVGFGFTRMCHRCQREREEQRRNRMRSCHME